MAVRITAFIDEVNVALGSVIDSITSLFVIVLPQNKMGT